MKKLLTIFLLIIALFNLGGYGLFMACLEETAVEKMDRQVDKNNYDASALVTIKVPVTTLPYYTNSEEYERKTGEIEIDGVTYNYVSSRIYHDSLEVQCIPNTDAAKLRTARNEFYKLCNDLENAGKNKKANTAFKFFSPGNCKQKNQAIELAFAIYKHNFSIPPQAKLPFVYALIIENPPEYC